MKAYLDTNVLVAGSVENHPHHVPAFDLVKAVKEGDLQGFISTHGLAEYYAVITRAPFTPRVHPSEAARFIEENVLPYFGLLAISVDDYKAVLKSCTAAGLIGGVVGVRAAYLRACD